ncbi:hypothetical protein TSAR_005541 [Trichomalopsis sarcophagae]|uniref:Uncharacterized protein n=1 Tax=Trichomalopsis sarcophagae TaxID=543379 RepID=A0A232FIT0_9HYME|nr:hypothetical protein TSAR_005541 [Trichomalopsis sarcophagae]
MKLHLSAMVVPIGIIAIIGHRKIHIGIVRC